ncbi:hypothetical protein BDI4_1120021 [Burkholderia diffusa]|nr:hypothetical protein BDI4_1120021 [Burkholderia diffusa]
MRPGRFTLIDLRQILANMISIGMVKI